MRVAGLTSASSAFRGPILVPPHAEKIGLRTEWGMSG
jgi:hypothetical protein